MEKSKFVLQKDYPMRIDGKEVQPGETLEMDDHAAEPYLESGRLIPAKAKTPPAPPKDKGGKKDPPPKSGDGGEKGPPKE